IGNQSASSADLTALAVDLVISVTMNDVRDNATDLDRSPTPVVPDLTLGARMRVTDSSSCYGRDCTAPSEYGGTTIDFEFGPVGVDCVPNGDPNSPPGSDCNLNTTANTFMPGAFGAGRSTI